MPELRTLGLEPGESVVVMRLTLDQWETAWETESRAFRYLVPFGLTREARRGRALWKMWKLDASMRLLRQGRMSEAELCGVEVGGASTFPVASAQPSRLGEVVCEVFGDIPIQPLPNGLRDELVDQNFIEVIE